MRTTHMQFIKASELADAKTWHKSEQQSSVPTGIESLDRETGGIKPGSVWVIASRPSVGYKEVLAMIALHVATHEHVPTLILYGHMSPQAITEWFTLFHASLKVTTPFVDNEKIPHSLLSDARNCLNAAPFYVASDWVLNLEEIELSVAKIASNASIHASGCAATIFIDSIQRLEATLPQTLSEIAQGLKAIAQRYGVAFILSSNLSRKLETSREKRPSPHDLPRYSAIAAWLDHIVLLYRDECYNPDSDSEGVVEICGLSRLEPNPNRRWTPRQVTTPFWIRGEI